MKILLSAYTCGPTNTSEPGNAWRAVHHALAEGHEVWAIIRGSQYEKHLRSYMAEHPMPNFHPVFLDLSPMMVRLSGHNSALRGNTYYLLWQYKLSGFARELHARIGFDLAHHITLGRYWMPSGVRNLGIPFVWGPVGAAESAPPSFLAELPPRERFLEFLRDTSRSMVRLLPGMRDTARKSTIAIGISKESCEAIRQLGAREVRQLPQAALSDEELAAYGSVPPPPVTGPFRAICIGRLVHWKGVYLGIRAFALFARQDPTAELWIVSNGPFLAHLRKVAAESGVADRIHFLGHQPKHSDLLEKLAQVHVLLHLALHEAFGNVCMEAMAAGRPVACLDIGGPAFQVTPACGFAAPITNPQAAIEATAAFLGRISTDRQLLATMSEAARRRVQENFTMRFLGQAFSDAYRDAIKLHAEQEKK
jgi:glycosyltransferase involved in cell wall biosynthesis